ncbi:MAG: GerMN domain-containing protein [Treponema sp.]|nr:GerMN domain-containing protein [Treponema sp.]
MKIDFDIKKNLKTVITGVVVVLVLIISMVLSFSSKGTRRTFVFPSVEDGEYIVESRYLPKNPLKDNITYYIDELLLGSQVERTKLIFAKNTRVLSCFTKDNVLYVNLSNDLLNISDNVIPIKEGIDLLKRNIKQNFGGSKSVEIYVDGNGVFENY